MTVDDLIPEAKIWIRKNSSALDSEVIQTMSACLLDLKKAGIPNPDVGNPLIQQAIKLYLKAQFGYGDENGKFAAAYDSLRDSLALCSDFNGFGGE